MRFAKNLFGAALTFSCTVWMMVGSIFIFAMMKCYCTLSRSRRIRIIYTGANFREKSFQLNFVGRNCRLIKVGCKLRLSAFNWESSDDVKIFCFWVVFFSMSVNFALLLRVYVIFDCELRFKKNSDFASELSHLSWYGKTSVVYNSILRRRLWPNVFR